MFFSGGFEKMFYSHGSYNVGPPVINWFINPSNYSYLRTINQVIGVINQLSYLTGASLCSWIVYFMVKKSQEKIRMITGGVPTRFAHDLTDQNMRCSWLVRSLISKKMKKWSPAPLPHLTSDVFFHNRFNRLLLPSGNLT